MNTLKEQLLWTAKPSQLINFGWMLSCLLVLPIPFAIWNFVVTACNEYALSTERFMHRQGVFSKTIDGLELYRVRDYRVEAPFFLRLFGLANIVLFTSDISTPTVVLRGVRNAENLVNVIRENVEVVRWTKGVRVLD